MDTKIAVTKYLTFVVTPPGSDVIMALAKKHHWVPPQVIKHGGMIDGPVFEGNWKFEPLINYSTVSSVARKRIDVILKSVPVAGVIVGHEIEVETRPKVKPLPWIVAPEQEPFRFPQPSPLRNPQRDMDWEIDWKAIGDVSLAVLKVVGVIALGALVVLGALVGGFAGCMTDPNVVIVTQEGEWIEIYRDYSSDSS